MASNFTIEGRLKQMNDIQRKYMFELVVPKISQFSSNAKLDDLVVRCKQVSIPGRSVEPIESNFMGMKQLFPGRVRFNGVINVTFEETEDMKIMKTFYDWREKVFGVNPAGVNPGFGGDINKRAVSTDIYIDTFKYNGEPTDYRIRVHNAWPQDVPDSDLAMAANEAVTYQVGFAFDFWTLEKRSA